MPLVSVVIGTYNRADYLLKAILSVLSQTLQDFEIVVVDDASPDHTSKVIHDLQEKRIHYIRHDVNKGIAAVRNTGLLHSSGKYIAYLDDDDEWLPQKLQVQVDQMENQPANVGLTYSGFFTINRSTGERVGEFSPMKIGEIVNRAMVTNWIGTTSVPLIRKYCFDVVGHFDERLSFGEDWDMFNRILKEFDFEFTKEKLVNYYVHDKPQLTKNSPGIIKSLDILLHRYGDLAPIRRTIGRHYVSVGARYSFAHNEREGRKLILKGIFLDPYHIRHYGYYLLSLIGSKNYQKFRAFKKQATQFFLKGVNS